MSKDDTRDKILSVADRLFSQFGFHKTSMDEIAKIARKAKGSLYYHFSSKEDLFKEVVSIEMVNLRKQLSIVVEDEELSASKKMEMYLVKRMEVLNDAANYHETLKADFFEHFDFIDGLRSSLDEWERSSIEKIISQGIETGEFIEMESKDVFFDMFIMVLKGLEIPFFLQGKYSKYSPHLDNLMEILTKGLSK